MSVEESKVSYRRLSYLYLGTSFHKALLLFQRKEIYANCVNDRTVPFVTGGIPTDHRDPFAKAERIARSLCSNPNADVVDLIHGGLILHFQEKSQEIIKSMEIVKLPHLENGKLNSNPRRRRWRFPALPFIFRFSTYASVPYGLGYIIPFLMPIIVPSSILYFVSKNFAQNHSSRRRIQAMSTGDLSTTAGQLQRVGLALEDTFQDIAEDIFPVDGGIETSFYGLEATDPVLTPAQKRMSSNLNAIPGLEKYYVYLPREKNSHGAIICRNINWEGHRRGLEVLKWWSARFVI